MKTVHNLEARGCSSCPFGYLEDGCLPTCTLDEFLGFNRANASRGEESPDRWHLRDDAPPECPLRDFPRHISLKAGDK